jgi:dTDP-4-dehydrorhamnose reductase
MRVLIFGASGLIGSNLFRYLSDNRKFEVFGTYRNDAALTYFFDNEKSKLIFFECGNTDLNHLVKTLKPDWVINALGITKHVDDFKNIPKMIQVNTVFPHQLAQVCIEFSAKLIQISTDCVFSGQKGNYHEADLPDAVDLYGKSKALGEVVYGNNLTLRISTIGRELITNYGLLEWFLRQRESCLGYKSTIFSGIPSKYLGYVLTEYVLDRATLSGLYHIASKPINKHALLQELAVFYNKNIEIIENNDLSIDRSLNSDKFSIATGYRQPSLSDLINNDWL